MAKILVTGGRGMVGSYARQAFADNDLLILGSKELDVCAQRQVDDCFEAFRPEIVVHLAAATNVDRCQNEAAYAFRVNEEGTAHVARACQRLGCALVYVSSGAVFDGRKPEPYIESDAVSPVNIYGQSKLAGEAIVQRLTSRWYIARAGWIFGGAAHDVKFVGKLAGEMLAGRRELRIVDDKIGTPTYGLDFLRAVRQLLAGAPSGIYHLGNDGAGSRFRIAEEIRRVLGLEGTRLIPVSSDAFPLPAPRGRSEAIASCRWKTIGAPPPRAWQEALRDYLVNDYLPARAAAAR